MTPDLVEIGDGCLIVRIGTLSITVVAESATIFDTERNLPARKVPLSAEFWADAEDFLRPTAAA